MMNDDDDDNDDDNDDDYAAEDDDDVIFFQISVSFYLLLDAKSEPGGCQMEVLGRVWKKRGRLPRRGSRCRTLFGDFWMHFGMIFGVIFEDIFDDFSKARF